MNSAFPAHGRSEFRRDKDILIVDLFGPWNVECIDEARRKGGPLADLMLKSGPVGVVVVEHRELAGTPEALQSVRAEVEHRAGSPIAAVAWVVDANIEGREILMPAIEALFLDTFPVRFFANVFDARNWVRRLIADMGRAATA